MDSVAATAQLPSVALDYAKTVYCCLNPGEYPKARCVYLFNRSSFPNSKFRSGRKTSFVALPFDITRYDRSDTAHTAWFYKPQEAGGASWFGPLQNHNVEDAIDTISYGVPLYKGGAFLGVVGMDISMALLRNVIDNLGYDAGFGFLFSKNGDLMYHKDFPGGLSADGFDQVRGAVSLRRFFMDDYVGTGKNYVYTWQGERHRIVLNKLRNGMVLAVSIPEAELLLLQSQMLFRMSLLFVVVLAVALLLANGLALKVIRPIQTLTAAASRIARGELNAAVTFRSDDELGELADAIRKVSVELKEYITYVSAQAYTDVMTGIRNKSAYLDKVKELEQRIAEHMAEFTVYVFDVNGLKRMNDTLGHEYGDMLIRDSATVLKAVFKEDCIYRVGGDEFVVIDERTEENGVAAHLAAFDEQMAAFNKENDQYEAELAVSKGAATFDEKVDVDFKTVFARADEAMYACKAAYYTTHEDRRRR